MSDFKPNERYIRAVNENVDLVRALVERCRGQALDARYLGFFECFNRQLYFEAHEVLEELWLAERRGPEGTFYKGLIQLAGAFVHLQKRRPNPAGALLGLAQANLANYPPRHLRLDVEALLTKIACWRRQLAAGEQLQELVSAAGRPELRLDERPAKKIRPQSPPAASGGPSCS